MAREWTEHKPEVNDASAVVGRVGDNVVQQLFKELAEMGPDVLGGGGPRPPGESALLAGVSPEQGTARLQGAVDDGVRRTPELYEHTGGGMRSGSSGGDSQVNQQTVDSNVQQTSALYQGSLD